MAPPVIRDLLADLAIDPDFAGAVANLEGCYLQPLERLTTDPTLLGAVMEVRRMLAQTDLRMRKLAAGPARADSSLQESRVLPRRHGGAAPTVPRFFT